MVVDLSMHAYGLTTELMRHVHGLLHDYDENLSLRRIPDRDPIMEWALRQDPPRRYGVWEENVGHGKNGIISNWVFTIAEANIDERVFARIIEGDMKKRGIDERVAKLKAINSAYELSGKKKQAQQFEERREEMIAIGRLSAAKSTFRHKINGEDYILGDTLRPVRTLILK